MKRKWWIVGLVGLLIVAGIVTGVMLRRGRDVIDDTKNLVRNGGFEEVIDGSTPEDWAKGMWYWDAGVSYLYASDVAYSGDWSVCVENVNENDARFEQTVSVQPDSWYRISCMVRAEGCGAAKCGAGISVENTFQSSPYAYDTDGEWTQLTLYGLTDAEQRSITIMCRVGGYGSENVGKAWFDDVEVVRVAEPPEGVIGVSLRTNAPASASEEEIPNDHAAILLVISLLTLIIGAALILRRRGPGLDAWARVILFSSIAVGLIVRIIFAITIRGFGVDITCFEGWSDRMAQYAPWGFYNAGWCDYPPGYMLLLWPIGLIRNALNIGFDTPAHWLLVKLIPIGCDIATALFIDHIARKKLGRGAAALIGATYVLNPLVVFNSACWGQVDTVLTLMLLIAVYMTTQKRWRVALTVFGLAALVKPQALMFAPVGVIALGCELVLNKNDRRKTAIEILTALGIALGVFFLVAAPFSLGQHRDPFSWLFGKYTESLSEYNYITVNACNLFQLLGKNWIPLENVRFLSAIGWSAYVVAFGLTALFCLRSKKKRRLFLLCAMALSVIFAFGAKMHERYIFPILGLLCMAYAEDRDWRILAALAALSASAFLNVSLVFVDNYLYNHTAMAFFSALINTLAAPWLAWTAGDMCLREHVLSIDRSALSPTAKTSRSAAVSLSKPHRLGQLRPMDSGLHMSARDWAIMFSVTILYACLTFYNLGSMTAPQTAWTSSNAEETILFDLGEVRVFHIMYYGGICNSSFTLSFSEDGEAYSNDELAVYDQGEIFRWIQFTPQQRDADDRFVATDVTYPQRTARYVCLRAERPGLVLHEIAFILDDGTTAIPVSSSIIYGGTDRSVSPEVLYDEQDTVPDRPSYYNSTYFDEIYHARTAYEFLHNLNPYETTHPPLGKVLMMWGIQIFGMTPFGWRFMGALFGVMMLPVMYLLGKQLFKKTGWAALVMGLMALDSMHFTQTRIATIDTFGVFFIMLMYLFMFRYCQMNFYYDKLGKTLTPLALSGIAMGLGVASKWIGVYAGLGLAVLFFMTMIRRYQEHAHAIATGDMSEPGQRAQTKFWPYFIKTCLFCVVFFIIVPCVIYYFSYYWYCRPRGGLTISRVLASQELMFNYHKNLTGDTHFFRSPWYEWPLIIKPMWYYSGSGYLSADMVSSISCMGNPAVWWVGLAALIYVIVRLIVRREGLSELLIVLGFLAQYLPWVLVPRSTFIYHYFASVPFIILATAVLMRDIERRWPRAGRMAICALVVSAALLFAAFYPLESGMPAPRSYVRWLRWFNWYNY